MRSSRSMGTGLIVGASGGGICALGLTVLIGWQIHSPTLVQVIPSLAPMTPMTATSFLVSGIALLLLNAGYLRPATLFARFTLFLAILVCLEYGLGVNFGIDQLFGTDYISNLYPGRMSQVSALCFIGSSVALTAAASRKRVDSAPTIVGVLASMIAAVGTVSVLSYLLVRIQAYTWTQSPHMALHSSAGFALLGLGLMAWAWKESSQQEGSPEWLPLSLGLGLAAAAFGIWQALIVHEASQLPLISGVILAGGILGALLVAFAVFQAQRARQHSREVQAGSVMLQKLFETAPDGLVMTDIQGRILLVNPRAETIFGFTRDEFRDKSIDDLVPVKLHELGLPNLERTDRKQRKEPLSWGFALNGKRRDGAEFPAEVSLTPLESPGRETMVVAVVRDITERKHAEAALRLDSEIFATMEEGVCLVRLDDGIIVHTNPKFEKMFGYSANELAGKHIATINAPTHKDPEEAAEEIRSKVMRTGVWRGEILHQRKDGTPFWCTVTVSTFHHPEFGTVGVSIHQDITDLKKARETLRASEERFRGIFEQGPIGVALLGADQKMNKTNPALCRMLGYSEAEFATMTPIDMTHPDDRKHCLKLLQQLDRPEIPFCKMEKRYLKKSGEIMWASLTASVIRDQEGKPLHGLGLVEDITEHRLADQKMAEQAALLNLAPDAIFVRDLNARITFWNKGAESTYGWTAKEALGRTSHELLQTRYPMPLSEIEAMVMKEGYWEGELEHTTRDGKNLVVTSRWSLQRDEKGRPRAALEINRDITERKHAEEQLRNLTERLSLAIRSAFIGVWDWDLHTNTIVWDDTIFAIFGLPKVVPMAYEKFTQRVHPDDLPDVQASLERAIKGKTQDFVEFRIFRPDGSVRHVYSASGVVLDERGNVIRVVGTAVDITERKRMEAQIEANKMQLVASARLSALGMMAGGVAHEINNPLGIIHALASDLRDMVNEEGSVPPEMVARNSARIRETADRIARIVKSLRQISREGSRDKLYPTRVGKVVEATLAICRERFRANAVTLLLPSSIQEFVVSCREVQIEQILLNLLQNAFDAVLEQPGEKWVRLNVHSEDDRVVISVTDSGHGVPEKLRAHIMEPFFTTKPVGKGTGLGLSLSKTIAEEHGGRLEYTEEQGHTCFSLILPLAREAEAAWT